jgi:hypothetical protein
MRRGTTVRGWLRARTPDWQPSHPTDNIDSSVSVERMSPDREPERGWLITIGPVTEMSDGHGLVPIVFLGPGEARGEEMIVRSFLESLDPDA